MTKLTPYYQRDGITIYCGDCLEIMLLLRLVFDAIITDPPYETTDLDFDKKANGVGVKAAKIGLQLTSKDSGQFVCFAPFTMMAQFVITGWIERYTGAWVKHRGGE